MPIVGDYAILSDVNFFIGSEKGHGVKTIDFNLPDMPHDGSRSILMFNIRLVDPDDFELEIFLNHHKAYKAIFQQERYMTMHEVLPKGLLKENSNFISFGMLGDGTARIGDVVLLYQRAVP